MKLKTIILILSLILMIGGSVWGKIHQWIQAWNHALSGHDIFNIWFWPVISVVVGAIMLFGVLVSEK